jgi:hypothetical protein
LVKDVLMELGDETEYYSIKSAILNLLDIRLGKRHQRIGLFVGSNHTPRTKLHLDLRNHLNIDWNCFDRIIYKSV